MNDACPCKNCDTRYSHCHSECVYYNTWVNEKHEVSAKITKLKIEQFKLDKVRKDGIRRWKKKCKRT